MTDIHAAAKSAERIVKSTRECAGKPSELQGAAVNDSIRHGPEVARALVAILANPLLLLKPPVWFQLQCGNYGFRTPWGTYWVNKSGDGWSAAVSLNGLIPIGRYEETAESAQAACLADFRERVRGMFQPVV